MRKPSGPNRIAFLSAALGAAVLALAPAARGETQTYLIQSADLLNMPGDCGGGSRYSACAAGSQPGFRFNDALPPGAVVGSVTIELNHGVQCAADTYAFQAQLNGTPVGSFTSPNWCRCTYRRQIVSLSVPASAYTARGTNTFLITNPSNCQGLLPDSDLGHAYARVTVTFAPTGGGDGGACDLAPVLQRIDALDAKIEGAGYATETGVAAGDAGTRAWLSEEHEATRAAIAAAGDETRQILTERFARHLAERDLAAAGGGSQEMPAASCLPEEYGGRLELTVSVVLETIEDHALAGCDVSTAEADLERGHEDLAAGDFSRACDWYAKAYDAARQGCP